MCDDAEDVPDVNMNIVENEPDEVHAEADNVQKEQKYKNYYNQAQERSPLRNITSETKQPAVSPVSGHTRNRHDGIFGVYRQEHMQYAKDSRRFMHEYAISPMRTGMDGRIIRDPEENKQVLMRSP